MMLHIPFKIYSEAQPKHLSIFFTAARHYLTMVGTIFYFIADLQLVRRCISTAES